MIRVLVLAVAVALAVGVGPAAAKSAKCFTTDDGTYPCVFTPLGNGDFRIAAPGKPTFELVMDSPGVAFGSAQFAPGGRFVALPGVYRRSADDAACWDNADTETRICAW